MPKACSLSPRSLMYMSAEPPMKANCGKAMRANPLARTVNGRFPRTSRYRPATARKPPRVNSVRGSLRRNTPYSPIRARPAWTANIQRQEANLSIRPPMDGASMGARAMITPI